MGRRQTEKGADIVTDLPDPVPFLFQHHQHPVRLQEVDEVEGQAAAEFGVVVGAGRDCLVQGWFSHRSSLRNVSLAA